MPYQVERTNVKLSMIHYTMLSARIGLVYSSFSHCIEVVGVLLFKRFPVKYIAVQYDYVLNISVPDNEHNNISEVLI